MDPHMDSPPNAVSESVVSPKNPDQNGESASVLAATNQNQPSTPNTEKPPVKNECCASSAAKKRKANVVVQSRLKPTKFAYDSIITDPVVTGQNTVKDGTFFHYDDVPLNRRGYKYRICKPNRVLTATQYSTTELPPYNVRASYFDKSQGVGCSEDMLSITTQNGWLSARCNVAMREGKHYFEYDIINANNPDDKAHVRVGIGRKESALDAPVGFDGYGYGLRDLNGQKVTLSRPQEFMSEGFSSGDTIGFLVELPPLERQRAGNVEFLKEFRNKHPKKSKLTQAAKEEEDEEKKFNAFNNIHRDQIAIKYKNGLFFEQFEYTRTKQMDHLLNPVTVFGETAVLERNADAQPTIPTIPESRIVVYKNGKCVGEMFNGIYSFLPLDLADDSAATDANTKQQQNPSYRNTDDGSLGYYPMMSVFSKGVVKINAGPDFKHPVPEGAIPLCERYDESVVEEWLWDLVDEVEADYLDSFD
ncbi:hypothetical protein JCM33374_g965 [Metschnikowia sp. JCM 33374]|nr:hypothetical protein JCM33374_g965 [Metschnikowia sp. JCM 33374]